MEKQKRVYKISPKVNVHNFNAPIPNAGKKVLARCACNTNGHCSINYKKEAISYFLSIDPSYHETNERCPTCGFFYFMFVKGGAKENAKNIHTKQR